MKQSVAVAVLVLLLSAFATFVWPTRYRYSPGSNTRPRVLLVRVDRFTGRAFALADSGWAPCSGAYLRNPWGLPDLRGEQGSTGTATTPDPQ